MNRYDQYTKFIFMLIRLLLFAYRKRIPIRGGSWNRGLEECRRNVEKGTGILNSKHRYSLAVDLWIAAGPNGRQITWTRRGDTSETIDQFRAMGEYWEKLGGVWGGRFERFDPYHFEIKGDPA